jgi:hypothetical protein
VLEELPVNQRRAILLREWQGLSYREVADELGVSQAAVETLIFRARRSLAAGLQEAPAGSLRKRLRRGADVGGLLAFAKTLFGGGGAAAVKAVAVIALAGAAVATTAAEHMRHQGPAHRTPIVRPTVGAKSGSAAVTAGAAVSTLRGLDRATRVHGNGGSRGDARLGASSTASPQTVAKSHGSASPTRVGSAKPLPNASSSEGAAAPEQAQSGRSAANHPSKPASASPNTAKGKAKAKGASAAPADPPSTGDTHPNRGNGAQTGRPPSPDTTASGSADGAGKAKTDADGNANPNANGSGPPQTPPGQSSDPHGNSDRTK